jgi:ubiquitin-protein ligase E3 C
MLPVFGDDRRRLINLGGVSSASSHATILEQAKALRSERLDNKRKEEKAIRLQAWWRGLTAARTARAQMRTAFQDDVTGITGLRCLVLIGDDQMLAKWSEAVYAMGDGVLGVCLICTVC